MATTMMGKGVYDAREIEHLLAIPTYRLSRWAAPDPINGRPLVSPAFDWAFSFHDLVALWVVNRLRSERVPEADIRLGCELLSMHFKLEQPLSHKRVIDSIATSGNSFLARFDADWTDIGKNAQGVFQPVVLIYLERIEFGEDGQPYRWNPWRGVTLDPLVQAGTPCIAGRRIPTSTVADLLEVQAAEELAEDFEVSVEAIAAAAEFEEALTRGVGLAA